MGIATGLKANSKNRKTGAMVQTYILRSDMLPTEAVKSGNDASICGDCPHRGDGTGKARTCYVTVGQGAQVVYRAYKRGVYPVATDNDWAAFLGKAVRMGTYGDPAAAPRWVWKRLHNLASKTTGYTHQWRILADGWQDIMMASADTPNDAAQAHKAGWRTFRVTTGHDQLPNEVLCPASEEAGKKLTCAQCGACNGNSTSRKGSIVIPLHGGAAVKASAPKLEARLIARAQ